MGGLVLVVTFPLVGGDHLGGGVKVHLSCLELDEGAASGPASRSLATPTAEQSSAHGHDHNRLMGLNSEREVRRRNLTFPVLQVG